MNRDSCEYKEVTDFAGSGLTYLSPSVALPRQGRTHLLQILSLQLTFHLRGSSRGRAGTSQVLWQLKGCSNAPSVPRPVPTLDPAGGLVDQGVNRGEALQRVSAVEFWEEGAEGFIVLERGRDPAHKYFGSTNINIQVNNNNSHFLGSLE